MATCTPRLPCRVPRANNTPSAARPGRPRSHGRPSAGIIGDGFPPGLCAGARTADPRRQSGPGRAPCRSRCPTRRRRQASAPSCRAAARRPTAPPARHHVLLPRGPRRRRVGSSPGVSGGPLPAVRQPRQDQSSSSSGLRFSASQLVPPPRPPHPAGRQRRACIQSPTLVHKINQRVEGHLAARGGGPGIRRARGGTFFRGSVFREQALLTRKGWGVERAPPAVVCYFRALRGTEGRK